MRVLPLLTLSAVVAVFPHSHEPVRAQAQAPASVRAASEFVKELTSRNVTVVAAKDPARPAD
jgi:hypothetical protein